MIPLFTYYDPNMIKTKIESIPLTSFKHSIILHEPTSDLNLAISKLIQKSENIIIFSTKHNTISMAYHKDKKYLNQQIYTPYTPQSHSSYDYFISNYNNMDLIIFDSYQLFKYINSIKPIYTISCVFSTYIDDQFNLYFLPPDKQISIKLKPIQFDGSEPHISNIFLDSFFQYSPDNINKPDTLLINGGWIDPNKIYSSFSFYGWYPNIIGIIKHMIYDIYQDYSHKKIIYIPHFYKHGTLLMKNIYSSYSNKNNSILYEGNTSIFNEFIQSDTINILFTSIIPPTYIHKSLNLYTTLDIDTNTIHSLLHKLPNIIHLNIYHPKFYTNSLNTLINDTILKLHLNTNKSNIPKITHII